MAFEAIVLVVVFGFLIVFGWVQDIVKRITGLKEDSKGLFFATIGFFIGAWLLILFIATVYALNTQ